MEKEYNNNTKKQTGYHEELDIRHFGYGSAAFVPET